MWNLRSLERCLTHNKCAVNIICIIYAVRYIHNGLASILEMSHIFFLLSQRLVEDVV